MVSLLSVNIATAVCACNPCVTLVIFSLKNSIYFPHRRVLKAAAHQGTKDPKKGCFYCFTTSQQQTQQYNSTHDTSTFSHETTGPECAPALELCLLQLKSTSGQNFSIFKQNQHLRDKTVIKLTA